MTPNINQLDTDPGKRWERLYTLIRARWSHRQEEAERRDPFGEIEKAKADAFDEVLALMRYLDGTDP